MYVVHYKNIVMKLRRACYVYAMHYAYNGCVMAWTHIIEGKLKSFSPLEL